MSRQTEQKAAAVLGAGLQLNYTAVGRDPYKIPKIGVVTMSSFRDQQKLTDHIHKKITFDVVSQYNGGDQLASKVDLS